MRPSQWRVLNQMLDAMPAHDFTNRSAPLSIIIRCKCGFRTSVFCRNALARKSKEYGAMRKHLEDVRQRMAENVRNTE